MLGRAGTAGVLLLLAAAVGIAVPAPASADAAGEARVNAAPRSFLQRSEGTGGSTDVQVPLLTRTLNLVLPPQFVEFGQVEGDYDWTLTRTILVDGGYASDEVTGTASYDPRIKGVTLDVPEGFLSRQSDGEPFRPEAANFRYELQTVSDVVGSASSGRTVLNGYFSSAFPRPDGVATIDIDSGLSTRSYESTTSEPLELTVGESFDFVAEPGFFTSSSTGDRLETYAGSIQTAQPYFYVEKFLYTLVGATMKPSADGSRLTVTIPADAGSSLVLPATVPVTATASNAGESREVTASVTIEPGPGYVAPEVKAPPFPAVIPSPIVTYVPVPGLRTSYLTLEMPAGLTQLWRVRYYEYRKGKLINAFPGNTYGPTRHLVQFTGEDVVYRVALLRGREESELSDETAPLFLPESPGVSVVPPAEPTVEVLSRTSVRVTVTASADDPLHPENDTRGVCIRFMLGRFSQGPIHLQYELPWVCSVGDERTVSHVYTDLPPREYYTSFAWSHGDFGKIQGELVEHRLPLEDPVPVPEPTGSPVPTVMPTMSPTPVPTLTPTAPSTALPSVAPTGSPTGAGVAVPGSADPTPSASAGVLSATGLAVGLPVAIGLLALVFGAASFAVVARLRRDRRRRS